MIPKHNYEIHITNGTILYVEDFEHITTKWGKAIAVEQDDGTPYFINDYEIGVIYEVRDKKCGLK